ncbi:MAG: ABC transporter ATP-binding protein, partial [Bacteroidota bacterium]
MIHYFENRFALSEKGARSLAGGIVFSALLNIVLMLPVIFLFIFLTDYLQPVIDPQNTVMHGIWYYTVIAVVFFAVAYVVALLQYKSTFSNIYTESGNRRISLAEKLRKLPLAFFGERNLSDLTSNIMNDNSMMEQLFSHAMPQLFASLITTSLIGVGLFFYQWQLALALLWVVPVALAGVLLSKKKMDRLNAKFHHDKLDVAEQIQSGLECVQEIKAYNGEAKYLEDLDRSLRRYEKSLTKGEFVGSVLINSANAILKLGMATVIIVGAYLLSVGTVDIFTYLIFLMISASIYNPIGEVFNHIAVLTILDVHINRIKEMESMPVQQGTTDYSVDNYDIAFDGVDFSYETGKQVLRNVSFTARQGEVTALVGPSGGGKSTSAKLAARFWDIDKGTITLGGQDISKIDPEALLKNYAVVFQDVLLFNSSVADNIRIGKPDATDEEIRRVAELARCDEFVSRMPEGYDTLIGENGAALSGGERQRISIARALLKDAPI